MWWDQEGFGVRFDWGPEGARRVGSPTGLVVIVDVLSFTTAVTVAVERGSRVWPTPARDDPARALARRRGAVLAAGRRETTPHHPWSLSPAALRRAPVAPRLVLASPNGAAIAAAASGAVTAACLRNADAVADWAVSVGFATPSRPVTVVAAGETWPDGALRPALEDLLGAGAVVSALSDRRPGSASPEAATAAVAFRGTRSVSDAVRGCSSARELAAGGFDADVEEAVAVGSSPVVPVLVDGAFTRG